MIHSISVTDIKNLSLSADAKEATFTLATRYAGDLSVTLPAACLRNLKIPADAVPAVPAVPAGHPGGVTAASDKKVNGKGTDDLIVSKPKTWMTLADAKTHGVVVIVFDHRAPAQAGFALAPDAAKELAAALVKQANTVVAGRTGKEK